LNEPGLTVTIGLVEGVFVASSKSVAVSELLPAVLKVTEKVLVPEARSAAAGKVAWVSVEVIWIVKFAPLAPGAVFQFVSTPFTVTLKAVPAVRAVGEPAFPVDVPAAELSPGMSNSNFTKLPATSVNVPKLLPVEPSEDVVMPFATRLPPSEAGR